jgi:hypothetical protein
MKKLFVILFIGAMFLMASTSPFKKKLIGVWKIQSVDIKGTKMLHEQLGLPFIEFNEEGGFMIKVSASGEKGRYSIKGNSVTLKFLVPKKPVQHLNIIKLDAKEFDYNTTDSTGTVNVKCYKVSEGEKD